MPEQKYIVFQSFTLGKGRTANVGSVYAESDLPPALFVFARSQGWIRPAPSVPEPARIQNADPELSHRDPISTGAALVTTQPAGGRRKGLSR
jgi:hypothetical protein